MAKVKKDLKKEPVTAAAPKVKSLAENIGDTHYHARCLSQKLNKLYAKMVDDFYEAADDGYTNSEVTMQKQTEYTRNVMHNIDDTLEKISMNLFGKRIDEL